MSRSLGELDYDSNASLIAALPYPGEVPKPELLLCAAPDGGGEERPDKYAWEARRAAARMRALVEGGAAITAPGSERPIGYGDIAVLLRSANVTGPVWRRELAAAGIPVEAGQSGGFFASPEIEVMLALLSLIDNPRQDVQLVSVLRSALFGFTPDELTAIRLANRDGELWDALNNCAETDEKCAGFVKFIAEMREFARESELTELIALIYERLGLLRRVRRACRRRGRGRPGSAASSSWPGSTRPGRGAACAASTSGLPRCARPGGKPAMPAAAGRRGREDYEHTPEQRAWSSPWSSSAALEIFQRVRPARDCACPPGAGPWAQGHGRGRGASSTRP